MALTWEGTKRTQRPTRAWRRWQWVTAPAEPEPAAVRTYDELGPNLYRLACILTNDPEVAERLVLQTISAHRDSPSSRQDLSVGLYVAWLASGSPTPTTALEESSSASLLRSIHGLTCDARAALALCMYAGYTYRRAAAVLGIAPDRVAWLLGDALRSLGSSQPVLAGPTPAA